MWYLCAMYLRVQMEQSVDGRHADGHHLVPREGVPHQMLVQRTQGVEVRDQPQLLHITL